MKPKKPISHNNYGNSIEELERKQRDMKNFAKEIMRSYKIPKPEQVILASTLIGAGRVATRIESLKKNRDATERT